MFISKFTGSVAPSILRKPDDGDGAGGAGGSGDGGAGNDDPKNQDKTVPLSAHKEVLQKFHDTNSALQKVQKELEEMRKADKDRHKSDLEGKGDFKTLYETTKSELESTKTKFQQYRDGALNTERARMLEAELKKAGLKAGHESVMDFAAFDEMPTEMTTMGRILVHGVEEQAKKLKEKYSFAFDQKPPPKINNGGGSGGRPNGMTDDDGSGITDEQLTPQFMVELETKNKALRNKLYPRFLKVHRERQQGG